MSNLGFEKKWNELGGILIRTPVGDKFIHEAINKQKADLGGEQSGHILSKINNYSGDKDNIASFETTKILVEKLQQQKKVDIKFKPIKGADHFYENYSDEFENSIKDYINETIETK